MVDVDVEQEHHRRGFPMAPIPHQPSNHSLREIFNAELGHDTRNGRSNTARNDPEATSPHLTANRSTTVAYSDERASHPL